MSNQREFLQLEHNYIADVTFKFPTGLKKEGQFGPYFLYTVVHDGKEKILKATERLEKKLRTLNIQAGQTLSLVKEAIFPKKGEPFSVINILESTPPPTIAATVQQAKASPNPPTQPSNSAPSPKSEAAGTGPKPATFTADKQTMYQSIIDAVDITKAIGGIDWRNSDIEKIGVSLFLSRTGQLNADQLLTNGNARKPRKAKLSPDSAPERALESVPAAIPATLPGNGARKDKDLPF